MSRNALLAAAATVAAIALLLAASFACADEAGDVGRWFKSLTQPGTGMSCCEEADCKQAEAEWRGGQWWAVVRGRWTAIPPDKVLRQTSIMPRAVVCSSPAADYYGSGHEALPVIYCFVPPFNGA
jgi:hypothetical protein